MIAKPLLPISKPATYTDIPDSLRCRRTRASVRISTLPRSRESKLSTKLIGRPSWSGSGRITKFRPGRHGDCFGARRPLSGWHTPPVTIPGVHRGTKMPRLVSLLDSSCSKMSDSPRSWYAYPASPCPTCVLLRSHCCVLLQEHTCFIESRILRAMTRAVWDSKLSGPYGEMGRAEASSVFYGRTWQNGTLDPVLRIVTYNGWRAHCTSDHGGTFKLSI